MQFKDYYDTLGVTRGASAEEIKRAYRKLARKFHPDVSKERNAEARFKDVQEAYEVLKDPDKRATYDQLGRDYRPGQQFRPPPGWEQRFNFSAGGQGFGAGPGFGAGQRFSDANGFSDFFSTLFGGGAGPQAAAETDAGELEITVEEAFAGTKRRVNVTENGRARPLDVQIPSGITEGQALRVGGVGSRAALLFRIKVRPHPLYLLQGKDVQVELPIAPWEAALGAKVPVPTLKGTVELTIPAGAQSGQKLRLRGRGLPGSPSGDQLVVLKLVTPAADSDEAREAYERMKRDLDFNPRTDWP